MACRSNCGFHERKEIWLVQTREFIGRKEKKLSTKLMGVCSGKVFTAHVCWGGIVDIK